MILILNSYGSGKVLLNIKPFFGKYLMARSLQMQKRKYRGISDFDEYLCCLPTPKKIMHALRDCEAVKELWKKFIYLEYNHWNSIFSQRLSQWMSFNLQTTYIGSNSCKCPTLSSIMTKMVWSDSMLWLDRNQLVFFGTCLDYEQFIINLWRYLTSIHHHLFVYPPSYIDDNKHDINIR